MRSTSKRNASRQRIVQAAGRAFRSKGLAGVGVDGLAQGAELTSGAFYFHFASKMEAFVEAVRAGLQDLKAGIENFRTAEGTRWLDPFVNFYLTDRRTCDAIDGCALPSLTPDVERAGPAARQAYEESLREVAAVTAEGLAARPALTSAEQSWALLALLSGGVAMARAVNDPHLSEEIAAAVRKAARELASPETSRAGQI